MEFWAMGGIAWLVWLAIAIFCLILAIAWIILPFALIGTKPLLRELIAETRRTNALLEQRASPASLDPRIPPA
jgi:heme exporter protein D